jgi:DNA-binding NarL/FixJ family response regulator
VTAGIPRCLVADDHPALLRAVSSYLTENGFDVVGMAESGDRAVAIAERERPELAVLDYRMPRTGGAELVRRVRAVSPVTKVAVYTAEADEALVAGVLEAGAAAVVLKEAPLADLVRALDAVRDGRAYVDAPFVAQALTAGTNGTPGLTPREIDVLRLLADGLSHEQVGRRLQISAETARTHLRKSCGRLGAATRTEAVARAIRLGLI